MKKIALILSMLISTQLFAQTNTNVDLVCAYNAGMKYKDIVKFEQKAHDKFRHCTISCVIGLECGITSSAIIGIAKEIADVFGTGTPEWEDLLADVLGIRISRRASVSTLSDCAQACDDFYPLTTFQMDLYN